MNVEVNNVHKQASMKLGDLRLVVVSYYNVLDIREAHGRIWELTVRPVSTSQS
jgi:hypothetical protein